MNLHERREAHRRRHPVFRVVFAIAGALVLIAGVAMLALPGPAFLVIPIGLAMLAMEFAWAERALHKVGERAAQARDLTPAQRLLGVVGLVLVAGAAVTAVVLWDVPVLPDS